MYENSHFSELSEVVWFLRKRTPKPCSLSRQARLWLLPARPPLFSAASLVTFSSLISPDFFWFPSIRLVYCFLLPTTKPSLRLTSYSLENATEKCNFNAHFSHLYWIYRSHKTLNTKENPLIMQFKSRWREPIWMRKERRRKDRRFPK